ncbi:MAG: S9 family peptidase [Acidobacteriota bacterium]
MSNARRGMRPDDLYLLRRVGEVALAPDGDRVVYTVHRIDRERDTALSQLWTIDDDQTHRPLTFDDHAGAPVFSPDGRYLAYRGGPLGTPAKLYVLRLDGGAPHCLTDDLEAVSEIRWLPDSSGLVFTAVPKRDELDDQEKRRPRRMKTLRYRANGRGWIHDRPRQVWVVRLPTADATPTPRALTRAPIDHWSPAVDPSGSSIAFLSARHLDADFTGGSDVFTLPLPDPAPADASEHDEDGKDAATPLTDGGEWDRVVYAPDGSHLAVLGRSQRQHVGLSRLHVLHAGGGAPELRDDGFDGSVSGQSLPEVLLAITDDGHALVMAPRRGAVHLDRIDMATGARATLIGGQRTLRAAATRDLDRRIVFTATDPTSPGELWQRRDGVETRLTHVNHAAEEAIHFIMPEAVTVESADGTEVEAFVYRSPDTDAADHPNAGLVLVHGGPKTQYGWSFLDEFHIFAHAGWTVLGGNPRGSDGYGDAFARALVGRLGEPDWQDVQALTDSLAERDEVDAARIGIAGGSYGGFMASWAIGHSDRYRAALVERAVTNWETMQGTSDIGGFFVSMYTDATTASDVEALRRQSPIHHAAAVTTPTLILHSEEDWRCPPEQAEQLFVALRLAGVETELVRFPEADHDLSRFGRPAQRVERFDIILEFFRRHLDP